MKATRARFRWGRWQRIQRDLPVTLRDTLILYRRVRIAARCSMSAINRKMFMIPLQI